MKSHKSIVESVLQEICELVQMEEFSNVVEELVSVKCRQDEQGRDTCAAPNVKKTSEKKNLSTSKVGMVYYYQLPHHYNRKGVGLIPAGGPIVVEFFSAILNLNFYMCSGGH